MPLDVPHAPQPDAAAPAPSGNRLAVVDSDIHPAIKTLADLRPYLSNQWWEYLNTYGNRRKNGSLGQSLGRSPKMEGGHWSSPASRSRPVKL